MKLLLTEQRIQEEVINMAFTINMMENKPEIILCVLPEGVLFFSDLIKRLNFDFKVDFVLTETFKKGLYHSCFIKGPIKKSELYDKNVMVIDAIVNSGKTLQAVDAFFFNHRCKEKWFISLLKSKDFQLSSVSDKIRYVHGFEVENGDLKGYGIDENEYNRNLVDIYEINEKNI